MSEMKYGDENYQNRLNDAKISPIYSFEEALLAAEAECEKLRNTLEKCRSWCGKLNHVEQEETK